MVKSGFGKITKAILSELYREFDFEIEQVALNHFGKFYDVEEIPWQIQTGPTQRPFDLLARPAFLKALEDRNYDFVWIQIDVQHLGSISEQISEIKLKKKKNGESFPKIVYYVPIDMYLSEANRSAFIHCDVIVPYSEFGRKEISRVAPDLKERIEVIGCGYDPSLLTRIDSDARKLFRQEHFGIVDDSTFLISNINRNTRRKMLSTTLAAFAKFKQVTPNTKLYLHTEMHSVNEGFDIQQALV